MSDLFKAQKHLKKHTTAMKKWVEEEDALARAFLATRTRRARLDAAYFDR
jgi:hypothetical protein